MMFWGHSPGTSETAELDLALTMGEPAPMGLPQSTGTDAASGNEKQQDLSGI